MFGKVVNIQKDLVSSALWHFQIKGMGFSSSCNLNIQVTSNFYCLCYSPFKSLKPRRITFIRYCIAFFLLGKICSFVYWTMPVWIDVIWLSVLLLIRKTYNKSELSPLTCESLRKINTLLKCICTLIFHFIFTLSCFAPSFSYSKYFKSVPVPSFSI